MLLLQIIDDLDAKKAVLQAIVDCSNTKVTWSLSVLGGSLLALISTSYLKPVNKWHKLIYLAFIPGWIFQAASIYHGDMITRSKVIALMNIKTYQAIIEQMESEYRAQNDSFIVGLYCFSFWILSYFLWWLVNDILPQEKQPQSATTKTIILLLILILSTPYLSCAQIQNTTIPYPKCCMQFPRTCSDCQDKMDLAELRFGSEEYLMQYWHVKNNCLKSFLSYRRDKTLSVSQLKFYLRNCDSANSLNNTVGKIKTPRITHAKRPPIYIQNIKETIYYAKPIENIKLKKIGTEIVHGLHGDYYLVDLEYINDKEKLLFDLGKYYYSNELLDDRLIDGIDRFYSSIINTIEKDSLNYEIFVLGSADSLGDNTFKSTFNPDYKFSSITFLKKISNKAYSNKTSDLIIEEPITNKKLPMLRAEYIKYYFSQIHGSFKTPMVLESTVERSLGEKYRAATIILYTNWEKVKLPKID